MQTPPEARGVSPWTRQQMSSTAFSSLIAGALMLVVAYAVRYSTQQDSPLLQAAAVTFNWTMRVGAAAMLVSAVVCYAGLRFALGLDAVAAGAIGAALVFSGGVMFVNGYIMEGALSLIFGAMFLHSARGNWAAHTAVADGPAAGAYDQQEMAGIDGPESRAVDAGAAASRAEALKRVLTQKREEPAQGAARHEASRDEAPTSPEPGAAPLARSTPEAQPKPPVAPARAASPPPVPREQSGPGPQSPDPAADTMETDPDEPDPDGFLAELGREDDDKRTS